MTTPVTTRGSSGEDGSPWLQVLGTAQDGGYPQAGCVDACCEAAWSEPSLRRMPACLGLADPASRSRWIIDCTPAFPGQLRQFDAAAGPGWGLDGIFLTHAHVGHYVGLYHLGREVMGLGGVPVYCSERMASFIRENEP